MTYISLSLLFSSSGHNYSSKGGTHVPTYISISPRKDGTTAKTKCLNPQRNTSGGNTFKPLKRKLKLSSSNFSAILPKLRVRGAPHHRRPSSLYSFSSSNSNIIEVARPTLVTLPTEIISSILHHLDYDTLHRLSRTCNKMYTVCHDDNLWRKLLYADFKSVPPTIEETALVLRRNKSVTRPVPLNLKLYQNHLKLDQRWLTGKVNTRFLQGHDDSVYCLAWISKDLLVSGSRDKTLKVWHVPTNKCVRTIKDEHDGSILCMRVDQKNNILMTGSSDATCTIWSLPQLKPVRKLRGHGHSVLDICLVNSNRIVTSSRDHTLRVWDLETGLELRQLMGHSASVNAIEFVGENRVVSASGDSTLKLWDIKTGECIRTMEGHRLGLACVRYDGKQVYSGGLEGKIKVWNIETGECLKTLIGHAGMIRSIDTLNGKIVSGSYDRTLKVWDIETGACMLSFQSGHSNWIFNVLLSGTRIVSSGQEKRIMILDFGAGLDPLCN